MQEKKINPIPNIVTGINLISGCLAISMAIQDNYEAASYLIFLSVILIFRQAAYRKNETGVVENAGSKSL